MAFKTFEKNSGIIREFLFGICGDLKRFPESDDNDNGMIMASADTQSGKTNFMLCSSVLSMLSGKIPIIVVRNLYGDAQQLKNRCSELSVKLKEYLEKCKAEIFTFSSVRGDNKNSEQVKRVLTKSTSSPCIIICLGNQTQIGNLVEITKDMENHRKFDLLIDEIDHIDYGIKRVVKIIDSKEVIVKEPCGVSYQLNLLKKKAHKVIGVTATPLDVIFSEKEMKSTSQIRLSIPSDYRGFCDVVVEHLPLKMCYVDKKQTIMTFSDICMADPNMLPFLDKYSKKTPNFSWMSNKHYPNICLIKNGRIINKQEMMFSGIIDIYKRAFVVIVYNGNGVMIHHDDLYEKDNRVLINKIEVVRNRYSKLPLSDAIQYFKDNGGVEKYPRMIIISGDLAGRSISYVSKDYDWHLTDMYYVPSDSSSVPDMIQSAGRLCGRNKGKSPILTLYSTKKVSDSLYNGFHFTNEIISRAITMPLEDMDFGESLKKIPMNKKKMPKRGLTSKAKIRKKEFQLVDGDDGGRDIGMYGYNCDSDIIVVEKSGSGNCYLVPTDINHYKKITEEVQTLGLNKWHNLTTAVGGVNNKYKQIWNHIKKTKIMVDESQVGLLVRKNPDKSSENYNQLEIKFDV